jgi:ABC-type branched-subunit amino acid transport system permease subunit
VAMVGAAVLTPQIASHFWVFLLTQGFLTAIAALGLMVVVGWAGEVSLCQASLMGTGVYVTGYFIRPPGYFGSGHHYPFLLALGIAVLVTAGISLVVSLTTARLSGIYVMVLTLATQVAIERTIFTYPQFTGGAGGRENVIFRRPEFFGLHTDTDVSYYYMVLVLLAGVMVTLSLLRRSRHGRAMLLVKTDRRAAGAVGISAYHYKILAFVIAGILAGLAGAFTTPFYRSPPTLLQYLTIPSLFLLAIPVTAGYESLMAVVVVALVFTLLPHAIQAVHLSPFVVGGIGLIAGTLIGPRGFGGAFLDLFDVRRGRVLKSEEEGPRRPGDPPADGPIAPRPGTEVVLTDQALAAGEGVEPAGRHAFRSVSLPGESAAPRGQGSRRLD